MGKHPYLDPSLKRTEIIRTMKQDFLFLEEDLEELPSSLFRKMTEIDPKERYTAD